MSQSRAGTLSLSSLNRASFKSRVKFFISSSIFFTSSSSAYCEGTSTSGFGVGEDVGGPSGKTLEPVLLPIILITNNRVINKTRAAVAIIITFFGIFGIANFAFGVLATTWVSGWELVCPAADGDAGIFLENILLSLLGSFSIVWLSISNGFAFFGEGTCVWAGC